MSATTATPHPVVPHAVRVIGVCTLEYSHAYAVTNYLIPATPLSWLLQVAFQIIWFVLVLHASTTCGKRAWWLWLTAPFGFLMPFGLLIIPPLLMLCSFGDFCTEVRGGPG